MTGLDVCGHVDVKVPSKGRKFGQWKAWRRLWCVVRRSQAGSIQLIIGSSHHNPTSCIDIPSTAVLCRSQSRSRSFAFGVYCSSNETKLRQPIVFLAGRSETETQEWMFKIRNLIKKPTVPVARERGELSVSLIDNTHSRSAGLAGLYGTLRTTNTGLTVTDPSSGQVRIHWRWTEILSASLTSPTVPEDDKHILSVQTSSEFFCGEGELLMFCLEGEQLELSLSQRQSVCKPLPAFRVIDSPLPPVPSSPPTLHPLLATRRLSRSEGDLHLWPGDNISLFHLRTQSVSRNNNTSTDKVASSLISAGLGLMLTTPGCSEPDSLHDYQCLDSVWPEDTITDLPDFKRQQFKNNRRESGVSIASGIYEEIEENPDEFYEAMYRLEPGTLSDPPPLPPRKNDSCGSEEEYSTPDESLIYDLPKEKEEEEEEPLYLPMSAGRKSEDTYVVMANLMNQNNHMSEPVT